MYYTHGSILLLLCIVLQAIAVSTNRWSSVTGRSHMGLWRLYTGQEGNVQESQVLTSIPNYSKIDELNAVRALAISSLVLNIYTLFGIVHEKSNIHAEVLRLQIYIASFFALLSVILWGKYFKKIGEFKSHVGYSYVFMSISVLSFISAFDL